MTLGIQFPLLTLFVHRVQYASKITDGNPYLSSFCKSLEQCFRHRMQDESVPYFLVVKALAKDDGQRHHGLNALVRHIVAEMDNIKCLETNQVKNIFLILLYFKK